MCFMSHIELLHVQLLSTTFSAVYGIIEQVGNINTNRTLEPINHYTRIAGAMFSEMRNEDDK